MIRTTTLIEFIVLCVRSSGRINVRKQGKLGGANVLRTIPVSLTTTDYNEFI